MEFVDEIEFDRLGVFPYSAEEDTPAATMEDQIPEEVKEARRDEIMELQQEISLEKGEILTLIGPNGAGKSTVLKSIARQLETLGGSIYLDQKELSRLSGQQLSQSMAVVMTQKLRAEKMTCEDVVATGRYPYTGTLESFLSPIGR